MLVQPRRDFRLANANANDSQARRLRLPAAAGRGRGPPRGFVAHAPDGARTPIPVTSGR